MSILDKENKISNNSEKPELRRVQAYAGEKSLLIVLPKVFAEKLKITKGDYLTVKLDNQTILVNKAIISNSEVF